MEIFTVINGYIMVGSAVFLLVTKLASYIPIMRKEVFALPICIWLGAITSLIVVVFVVDIEVK